MCRRTCASTSPPQARATPYLKFKAAASVGGRARGIGSSMFRGRNSVQMMTLFLLSDLRKFANAFSISFHKQSYLGGQFLMHFLDHIFGHKKGTNHCTQKLLNLCSQLWCPTPKMGDKIQAFFRDKAWIILADRNLAYELFLNKNLIYAPKN